MENYTRPQPYCELIADVSATGRGSCVTDVVSRFYSLRWREYKLSRSFPSHRLSIFLSRFIPAFCFLTARELTGSSAASLSRAPPHSLLPEIPRLCL